VAARPSAYRRYPVEELKQLRDVVAVAAGRGMPTVEEALASNGVTFASSFVVNRSAAPAAPACSAAGRRPGCT
jgi:hypothetical protein